MKKKGKKNPNFQQKASPLSLSISAAFSFFRLWTNNPLMTISARTIIPTTAATTLPSLSPLQMVSYPRPPPTWCTRIPLPLPPCPPRWSRPRGRGAGPGSTGRPSTASPPRKPLLCPTRRGRSSSGSRGSVAALPPRPLLPTWALLPGSPNCLA